VHEIDILADHAMERTLRSLIRRPPVSCLAGTAVADALRAMHREGTGSIVITAPDGSPLGIFTRRDVLDRVALPGGRLREPMASVMTPAPRTLPAESTAYDAAMLIARHGIRHVPVVDGGRLIGVVSEHDLFGLQRTGIRSVRREIAAAADLGELRQAAHDIRGLARNLVAGGTAAEPLTLIVSTLNDALTRRVIELEQARLDPGTPGWCWLGFGSEGRYEQTISTDQDNGVIFTAGSREAAAGARERLLPFAQSVNRALAACGYPLCAGDIMAGNPRWCLSLDEWSARFDSWIADSNPEALLNSAIFFDFRPLHGDEDLAGRLRERLLARVAATPRFLREMARQALVTSPPLGLLGDFVTERTADGRKSLDLKKCGARLFVDCARVIGLGAGISHTSTAERLRQGGAKVGLPRSEASTFVESFFFIQMLRLRRQAALDESPPPQDPNHIVPDELNDVERRILKESLRQAGKLQARVALDHQL
jgi:CBS domain-containing protein